MKKLPLLIAGAATLVACGSPEMAPAKPAEESTIASKPLIPNDAPYPEMTTTTTPPAKECWDFTDYLKTDPNAMRITLPADSGCEIPLLDTEGNKTDRLFKAGQSMGIICVEQVQGQANSYLHLGPIETTQDPSKYSISLSPEASTTILYNFDVPADVVCKPEQLPSPTTK